MVRVADLDAALAWIRERPAPLAVYLFTRDRGAEARVLDGTRAGALVVNGTVLQAAIEALPFGGVGGSGFGRYHGRAGFETFSNMRAHVRASRFSLARLVEPPYGPGKRRLIERILGAGRSS
jgi:coniferyl-aldehyde dehydrogenase